MQLLVQSMPSPNHSARPKGGDPSLVVIHGTAGRWPHDAEWLCNPASKVSVHYYVRRDGVVFQMVPDERKAWHAGVSSWKGRRDCNAYSIGIELENDSRQEYTAAQYGATALLCRELLRKYPTLQATDIVGHHQIAPGRKTDPWKHFDWDKLRRMIAPELRPAVIHMPLPAISRPAPSEKGGAVEVAKHMAVDPQVRSYALLALAALTATGYIKPELSTFITANAELILPAVLGAWAWVARKRSKAALAA